MKTIDVKGMSCGHCKASVEKAMASVPGVKDVRVDLEGAKATFEDNGVDIDALKAAIDKVGFEPGDVK